MTKLSLLFGTTALAAFATTYNFVGDPTIFGDPDQYKVFSASLTTPTVANPYYTLVIKTDYPNDAVSGSGIPDGSTSVPAARYGTGLYYNVGDFEIISQAITYGVVLSNHVDVHNVAVSQDKVGNPFVPGDLYQGNFVTAGSIPFSILGSGTVTNFPYQVANGSTLASTTALPAGVVPLVVNVNPAWAPLDTVDPRYIITDHFTGPSNLLSGVFTVNFTSYACANSNVGGVVDASMSPEPGLATALGLLLSGLLFARWRLSQHTAR